MSNAPRLECGAIFANVRSPSTPPDHVDAFLFAFRLKNCLKTKFLKLGVASFSRKGEYDLLHSISSE